MANNLRIIYNNLADIANVVSTGSSYNTTTSVDNTSYPIGNIFKDTKGLVWRANWVGSSVTITIGWATPQTISSIIIPFSNLSTATTMSVAFFNNSGATGTPASVLPAISCVPVDFGVSSTGITGSFKYSYGVGTSARRYFTQTTCQSLAITITDTSPAAAYAEISRLIVGTYWSPVYNTEFGISVDINDLSSHSRTQAGNLITDTNTITKSLSFSLNYMTASDRDIMFKIMLLNGKRRSIFVSIFPEDTDSTKEVIHQIYGRLSDSPSINHPMYSIYATAIKLDEV